MTYSITGLSPEAFVPFFGLDDAELAARGAVRVIADSDRGFPCRICLEDARAGDELILLHHTSHEVATPYRSAFAIFVRVAAQGAAHHVDQVPPVLQGRPIALRGFGADAMLRDARLAMPDTVDRAIRDLLLDPQIAYIDAHNAAHGCFVARIERHEGQA